MTSERVIRTSLADQIAGQLRESVLGSDPSTRLPALDDLAQQFGVSKVTMRQAIEALVQDGLLIVRHGSGTYVKDASNPVPTRKRETREIVPLVVDPSDLSKEIGLTTQEIVDHLGLFLYTNRIALGVIAAKNPSPEADSRAEIAASRAEIINAIAPAIHANPDDQALRVGLISVFLPEVSSIYNAGSLGGAFRELAAKYGVDSHRA